MPHFTLLQTQMWSLKTKFSQILKACILSLLEIDIASLQENLSKSFCFFLKTPKLNTSKI